MCVCVRVKGPAELPPASVHSETRASVLPMMFVDISQGEFLQRGHWGTDPGRQLHVPGCVLGRKWHRVIGKVSEKMDEILVVMF